MTRKQAILQAIQQLSQNTDNHEIIEKLQEILNELPLSTWTEKSIIDAIESYAIEHDNTLPHVKALTTENSLPSNTVIYNKFGTSSMNTFFKKYFPQYIRQHKMNSPYYDKSKNYFLETFIENYRRIQEENKIKKISSKQYDKLRKEHTPLACTIMRNCGCTSYEELLILSGIIFPKKKIETTINVSYNDNESRNDEIKYLLHRNRK